MLKGHDDTGRSPEDVDNNSRELGAGTGRKLVR